MHIAQMCRRKEETESETERKIEREIERKEKEEERITKIECELL